MERLTEYHDGVAVIRDKRNLKAVAAQVAAYEDAYKLELESGIELVVPISDKMLADYADCEARANKLVAGKSCNGCSLNVDVFGSALCEYSKISKELLRRLT